MKLKKLLCTVLAASMLMTGMAVTADETTSTGTFRLEGEHFDLFIGDVPTKKDGLIYFDKTSPTHVGQSNGQGLTSDSTTDAPEFKATFYVETSGLYKMKYVATINKSSEWFGKYSITVNDTVYTAENATKLSEDPLPKWGDDAAYEMYVELNRGQNTISHKSLEKRGNNTSYHLYLDYVEFTPMTNVEIL